MAVKFALNILALSGCQIQNAHAAEESSVEQMVRVSMQFFHCTGTGKRWAECSQYVTSDDAPFNIEAVDAGSEPPVTNNKFVKDYVNWRADSVEPMGSSAYVEMKDHVFDERTMTAMVYAACLGDFDYVYVMEMCPKEMKVRSLRMVWNDQYTLKNDPGVYLPKQPYQEQQLQQQHVQEMTSVSMDFFHCCESGKGWAGCSQYVTSDDAPFNVQAVDALPGPPITGNKFVKDYLNWMAGVVQEFGPKATVEVKANGFDPNSMTAMVYAVFMGYSDYVYVIQMCPKEMKVCGLKKVWNDQYAFDNIPAPTDPIEVATIQSHQVPSSFFAGLSLACVAVTLYALSTHRQRQIRGPPLLLG